jgi:hypothetical protein
VGLRRFAFYLQFDGAADRCRPDKISTGHNAQSLFIVRATVADASKRVAFDTWYSREHLPDAVNRTRETLVLAEELGK